MVFPTFAAWATSVGKVYNGDAEIREAIYNANVEWIEQNNDDGTQGVSPFMDLTAAEFKARYLTLDSDTNPRQSLAYMGRYYYSGVELPDEIDWTLNGAVTDIKDQGQCGSCWAFSTTGSLEGRTFTATGSLPILSEQQFVDCDGTDSACKGGLMDQAFDYASKHSGGICTESSYPYTGAAGACRTPPGHPAGESCNVGLEQSAITGWKDVDNSEEALAEAVAEGPVSVSVDALRFQLYNGGILKGICGAQLDHGVLVVGYGVDSGTKYWKVKNSWANSWGENGYIRLLKGKSGSGECGIRKSASYPLISSLISV